MQIRELGYEELNTYQETILNLLVDSYSTSFQFSKDKCLGLCREKLESLKSYQQQDAAIVLGALESESTLVGFLWLFIHDYFGEARLHVNQIAICPQYRGKGIGNELMKEAEKQAKLNGINIVDLNVSETNSAAVEMYDKLGYRTERRYMSKKLD